MKSILISLSIVFIFPFYSLAETEDDLTLKFKTAYNEYENSLNTRNINSQMELALQAFEIGKELYGAEHIKTAQLGFNLARHYYQNNKTLLASKLVPDVFKTFEEHHGKNSSEVINFYIALANSSGFKDIESTFKYYDKALNIADELEDENPLLTADTKVLVGAHYLNYRTDKSKVLLDGREYLSNHLPASDQRVIEANFWASKYYLSRRKYDDAIDVLNSNIAIFEQNEDKINPLEFNTRAFLIYALEKESRSDEATKHCVAIGKIQKWDDNKEPRPLFRVEATYPRSMYKIEKEGFVYMEFVIDESGKTQDISVLSSTGNSFSRAAVKALKQWRYAPKYEDGKPVKAKSVVSYNFNLN